MNNYHITEDGPKLCSAKKGNCPITRDSNDSHYDNVQEAQKIYEEKMLNLSQTVLYKKSNNGFPKKVNLPQITLSSRLKAKKGGSYYGLSIPEESIQQYLKVWRNEIGNDLAQEMEEAKINRDGGYHFHITALSPKETRSLKKKGQNIDLPDFSVALTGIGSVSDNDKEAWFITADSKEIDEYRRGLELPKHNLHITIGFKNGDVHTKSKDSSSLKFI